MKSKKISLARKVLRHAVKYFLRYSLCKLKKHEVISNLIEENNFKRYVEIGIWKGKTLFRIKKRNENLEVYGIDDYNTSNYEEYSHGEVMASTNYKTYNKIKDYVIKKALKFKNIQIMIDTSLSAVNKFKDNSLDIVFIDALHDYKNISADIKAWLPKVRDGGILCGHDFNLSHFAVVKAVDDLIGCDNIEVVSSCAIWIHKKQLKEEK